MLFKKSILATMMVLTMHTAMAAEPMTVCPSIEMLKAFDGDFVQTHPMSFDPNKGMTMAVLQRRDFKNEEGAFAGYGNLFFIMSGISELPGEDAETNAQTLLSDMQLDTETAIPYHAYKDVVVPVCSYSLPGNETVKAVVYQMPSYKKPVQIG